jgi:hypothetical protein
MYTTFSIVICLISFEKNDQTKVEKHNILHLVFSVMSKKKLLFSYLDICLTKFKKVQSNEQINLIK